MMALPPPQIFRRRSLQVFATSSRSAASELAGGLRVGLVVQDGDVGRSFPAGPWPDLGKARDAARAAPSPDRPSAPRSQSWAAPAGAARHRHLVGAAAVHRHEQNQ